jgi:hypothetical protein
MRKKTEILAIRDQDIEKYVGEYDDDEGTIDDSLQEPAYTVTGSLALVPIYGILGMDISCDTIQATLRQLKQALQAYYLIYPVAAGLYKA